LRSHEPAPESWYLDPLVARQKGATFLAWIQRSVTPGAISSVLKTDVFEEANGEDRILDVLFSGASRKVGIDIDERIVGKARQKVAGFSALCADVRGLPFEAGSFDVVVSTSTLDHFEVAADLPRSIHELARVVAPGGTLLVILDNPCNPLYPLLKWVTRRGVSPFRLGHTVSARRLSELLRQAGLDVQSCDYLIHNPRLVSTAIILALRRILGRRTDPVISALLSLFELLDRLPTRPFTGCFTAVSARKPIEPRSISPPFAPASSAATFAPESKVLFFFCDQ
jgi:SAM-dependent methyltransferase